MKKIKAYIRIARPDNWFKNIFLLPGCFIAMILTSTEISQYYAKLIIGFIATCLISSANYVLNEWCDREFDRFHPVKNKRPSVLGNITFKLFTIEYILLSLIGICLAIFISRYFVVMIIIFLLMGFLYNVRPFRTKDKIYLDVISESFNNPIRLLLGWFIVDSEPLPPSSLIISYWMGGAFLMTIKRYSELRFIGNRELAGLYRSSFKYYTNDKLLALSIFFGISAAFFGGVFLVKYKIELLLSFPFYALIFSWYFYIGLKPNSAAQHPERMYKEKIFLLYVCFVVLLTIILISIRIPRLDWFLKNSFIIHNINNK